MGDATYLWPCSLGSCPCAQLAFASRLQVNWWRRCRDGQKCSQTLSTYHIDLGHRVDEDDGEDGDGEAEEEGSGEIPDDAPQANRQEEHQDHLQANKVFGKKKDIFAAV